MPKRKAILPALFLSISMIAGAQDAPNADNTKVNKGDGKPGAVTADQQKTNARDQNVTQNIRRSIMADKSLSTYAHNVKIITQDGTVTLEGPVKSDSEKQLIVAKAVAVAGADKVTDQLSVKQ
jgi:hyperosmotically inducible periplasmic protein